MDKRAAHTPSQRGQAWALHVFTTGGVVLGVLSLRYVLVGRADLAIIWMLATLLIDGVDGPIARKLMVRDRVPRIDGYVLDLIIDYVTCVIVPAAFMYQFEVVPQNAFGLVVLGFMVLTSALWFARSDMETEEFWFRGFPAAWNMVGPLMFLLHARTWIGAILTIALSVAQLTNMPFPHIMRSRFWRPATLVFGIGWVLVMVIGAFLYPDHPWLLRPPLYLACAYFVALAVVRSVHDYRVRARATMAG